MSRRRGRDERSRPDGRRDSRPLDGRERGRADERAREPGRRERPDSHWRLTAGREVGATPPRERRARAFVDVGVFGVVDVRDLSRVHFSGSLRAARLAAKGWVREGWARETRAPGERGGTVLAVSLTRRGAAVARDVARERGVDGLQRIDLAPVRPRDAVHDVAVYRACRREIRRLLERGAAIRRLRLERELQSVVALGGGAAPGLPVNVAVRRRSAHDEGLPVDAHGSVVFPDAQIEYALADGRMRRINVEVVSDGYKEPAVRAKATAGFSLHSNGPTSRRLLAELGLADGTLAGGRSNRSFEL